MRGKTAGVTTTAAPIVDLYLGADRDITFVALLPFYSARVSVKSTVVGRFMWD